MSLSRFKITSRELTPRTTVHDLHLDERVIATSGNETALQRIAACFAERRVFDLEAFRALPNPIRVAFVSSTCMSQPRFI